MQIPSVGRIVHFRLTAEQAEQINRRRTTGGAIAERIRQGSWSIGAQAHIGNHVGEGSVVPMIVTAVWPDEFVNGWLADHQPKTTYESTFGVNGQVLLDGTDSLWVTSAPQHSALPGCWFWPPRS